MSLKQCGTMKWSIVFLNILLRLSTSQISVQAGHEDKKICDTFPDECVCVLQYCLSSSNASLDPWTRCYENKIATCRLPPSEQRQTNPPGFIAKTFNPSHEATESPTPDHCVHIPSSALQKGSPGPGKDVRVVITVLNSSYFMPRSRGRRPILKDSARLEGTVLGALVLSVMVGKSSIINLSQPIRIMFKNNKRLDGACVFWKDTGPGHWSNQGCDTSRNESDFICSCNHLSFFAVLVNPSVSVDKRNAVNLSYISYIGSVLSVIFTIISLFIYTSLQRRRPEKSVGVHMQLTGALLFLHLSFLLSGLLSSMSWLKMEDKAGWDCQVLGLFLHWSLLAAFNWSALEGFHLYLLLIRVFNIYVKRYLLKLSLVGWGLPTVIAVVCWISGVYGKYTLTCLDVDNNNNTSTVNICWMSSSFPQRLLVGYFTVGYLSLVLLFNSAMLGVVAVKLWRLRDSRVSRGGGGWKMYREKRARLGKDCATVLGLSCVLGLPWALALTTYTSVPLSGLYLFTIFNSLQGVFIFLWSLALSRKSQQDNLSVKDPSTHRTMETTSLKN